MEIQIKRKETYVPEWNDNKKEKKPVTVELKYPTTGEFTDCLVYDAERKTGKQNVNKLFSYSIEEIKNLSIKDETGESVEIKTAEELLDSPALELLYYELLKHINSMNARIPVKN